MNKLTLTIIGILILFNCKSNTNSDSNSIKKQVSISYLIDSLNIKKQELKILIDKSEYTLSVISKSRIIRKYPVVFGTNPIDDKLMESDRSTPEGNFKIRDFYPHKSWSKFIWIDYPTKNSWKKHNKAKSKNRIPKKASIGGEIGIHGVPKNRSDLITKKTNWTWGCISLTNKDINDLYKVVYKNMKIEIIK